MPTYTYKTGGGDSCTVTLTQKTLHIKRAVYDVTLNLDEITKVALGFEPINLMLMLIPLGIFFGGSALSFVVAGNAGWMGLAFLLALVVALGIWLSGVMKGKSLAGTDKVETLPTYQSMLVLGTNRKTNRGQIRGYLIPFMKQDEQSQKLLADLKHYLGKDFLGVRAMKEAYKLTATSFVVRKAWTTSSGQYYEDNRNHRVPAGS